MNENTNKSINNDELLSAFREQLSEIEIINSIYPTEFVLRDSTIKNKIQKFLDGRSLQIPENIDFAINLSVGGLRLEIFVDLPTLYPYEEPDILIRCNELNRDELTKLNSDFLMHKSNVISGDGSSTCIYALIIWIQDNAESYKTSNNHIPQISMKQIKKESSTAEKFCRMWIYSHHIYNRKKREVIISQANNNRLTGFCVPGKPGIVCIEGFESDCSDWWRIIKSMTWQKIILKKIETYGLEERSQHQKFHSFDELAMCSNINNAKHVDMSKLSNFLENFGFSNILNELLGLR